jgi:hypothetical protein
MNVDILLPVLTTVCGVLIAALPMVITPSGPPQKKKWRHRTPYVALGVATILISCIQQSRALREQRTHERERSAEQLRHEREQADERTELARVEGGLKSLSNVVSKLSCPGAAEIGTVFKQEVERLVYETLRRPISEGKLDGSSSDSLLAMVPKVTNYLRALCMEWNAADLKLRESKYFETEHYPSREKDPALLEQKKREYDNKIELEREDYRSRLRQTLSDADQLRKALLDRLPKDAQTADDNAEAAAFAQTLADVPSMKPADFGCPPSINKAAEYLDGLAERVRLIKGLKGANRRGEPPSQPYGVR